jgi:hypothetical protein
MIYSPGRNTTLILMLTVQKYIMCRMLFERGLLMQKYNVLTLLTIGPCSVKSRMGKRYTFSTRFLHCLAWATHPPHKHYSLGRCPVFQDPRTFPILFQAQCYHQPVQARFQDSLHGIRCLQDFMNLSSRFDSAVVKTLKPIFLLVMRPQS